MPNETNFYKDETTRLDIQHELWTTALGSLYVAPLGSTDVKSVLDLGCGTGSWAHAFSVLHPPAQVLGIDLNPPAASPVHATPGNLGFKHGNIEGPWSSFAPDKGAIDFIFMRMLALGVRDWPTLFARAFDNLPPGGWIETQDTSLTLLAENTTLENSPALRWGAAMGAGAAALGYNPRLADLEVRRDMLQAAGFTNMVFVDIKCPIGPSGWRTEKEKKLAALNLLNVTGFLRPVTDKVLAHAPSMSEHEREQLCEEARCEITEESNKRFYLHL